MRPRSFSIVAAVLLVVAAAACGGGGGVASLNSDDVLVVGSEHITKTEFDAAMNHAKRNYALHKQKFPAVGTAAYKQQQDVAIGYFVQRAEIAQKAASMGIKVSDADVEKRLKQDKEQQFHGSEKAYRQALKRLGYTDQEVHDDVRVILISERVYKKVGDSVKVSDSDIKSYYKSHQSQYTQPATRSVRHILVKSKALADRLYAQIQHGAAFAKLAKKFSKDPSTAVLGGKYLASKGATVPQFDRVAFSLPTGHVSKPVKTTYGWHIIKAIAPVKPQTTTPLKSVKETIRQQLLQQKKTEAITKWLNDLKKEYSHRIRYQVGYKPPASVTQPSPTTTG